MPQWNLGTDEYTHAGGVLQGGGLGSHIQYMQVSLTRGMEETEESITSNK
jgi:hypothetical protein